MGGVGEEGAQEGFLPGELSSLDRARDYSFNGYPEGVYGALGAGNTMGCEAGAVQVLGTGDEAADSWDVD